QTQWDRPIDLSVKDEELKSFNSATPKTNLKSKSKTTKKLSVFKKNLSEFVVSILNLYLKGKIGYGKITNNEDFKYLARY
ncbi:MAG: Histone-lysine N-methyltransferase setd2, partial [Paramarteilia canceri]